MKHRQNSDYCYYVNPRTLVYNNFENMVGKEENAAHNVFYTIRKIPSFKTHTLLSANAFNLVHSSILLFIKVRIV